MKTNYKKFNQTNVYKKGVYAEKIIKKILNQKGYVVYEPFQEKKDSKWEFFDIMAIERTTKEEKKIFIGDVKAKARMNNYNATGIDWKHYIKYVKMSEKLGMPFKLFFVDEHTKRISVLELTRDLVLPENQVKSADGRTYPLVTDFNGKYTKVILFAVEQLKIIDYLSNKDADYLTSLNERGGYDLKKF